VSREIVTYFPLFIVLVAVNTIRREREKNFGGEKLIGKTLYAHCCVFVCMNYFFSLW